MSKVYYSKDVSKDGLAKALAALQCELKGKIGVKVHFGEEGNKNFIPAEMLRNFMSNNSANFVETNVLYVSKRRYTESHIKLAKEHGFDFAPIDILDDGGEIKQTSDDLVAYFGKNILNYDNFLIFSHFKGHMMAGFGGAIKNVAMGMASIHGKMSLHASKVPYVNNDNCVNCGICVNNCPANSISLNPVKISQTCIGCGSCIGICPEGVFGVPWDSITNEEFLNRLVNYSKVFIANNKSIYVNVVANISSQCDCAGLAPAPFMDDIGILVSADIVAIDTASHDLVNKAYGSQDTFLEVSKASGLVQLNYAQKLGLGSMKYTLIEV